MDRLSIPGRPNLVQAQAAAIRQELEFGRLAVRVLSILLSDAPKRRARVRPARWKRFVQENAGAEIRFTRTDDGGLIARLVRPDDEPEQEEGANIGQPAATEGEPT